MGRSPFLADGWSRSEPWGVWSQNEHATLKLPRALLGEGSIEIALDAAAFVVPQRGVHNQRVFVTANGASLGTLRLGDLADDALTLEIPASVIHTNDEYLELRFDLPDRRSPASLGLTSDSRELALGLKTATIVQRQ
jgi:hypothetical protein